MKRLFTGALALILSIGSSATTLNPIQLLNPTGSASGQAIVSTGASSVPAWGGVGVNGIAAIAANTVLANATGSSASPTAFAMPSCSTSSSALNWTTSTGFTCNAAINAATLVGATWASPPAAGYGSATPEPIAATTISATGLISPTSTIGIKGTTTNDSAQAGSVGEYVTASATATSLTSTTPINITSISLTAGDWDVTGSFNYTAAGSTTTSVVQCGVSTVSATPPANPLSWYSNGNFATAAVVQAEVPMQRISVASTTTVYLVLVGNFLTSTATGAGVIRARRIR